MQKYNLSFPNQADRNSHRSNKLKTQSKMSYKSLVKLPHVGNTEVQYKFI